MPTQLNRAALLAAIETVNAADKVAWEKRWERWREAVTAREEEWKAKWSDAWAESAAKIEQALKNGQPITPDLMPREHGSVAYFQSRDEAQLDGRWQRPPFPEFVPNRELVSLKYALSAIADDTVTPNALESLGVTRAALRDAVQAMGREAVSE